MSVLSVENLSKTYPGFRLEQVSFALRPGKIMGFIGRNGAGKTTTLKALLNFVHADSGSVQFFGLDLPGHELEIKQRLGFAMGGVDYYSKSRLRTITAVTRRFYQSWDEEAYRRCLKRFDLDESKTPAQLSAGMRVKYNLTLALSHRAELLILDEPTSGLDPVSRDDLLEVFLDLSDQGVSILFSTHITSDLDKCADDITYIRNGHILASQDMPSFIDCWRLAELAEQPADPQLAAQLVGCKRAKSGYTALIRAEQAEQSGLPCFPATLEDIMVHLEKEGEAC